MKVLSNNVMTNNKEKENIWYFDTAVVIHMTHNLNFYINPDLHYQTSKMLITDSTILKT